MINLTMALAMQVSMVSATPDTVAKPTDVYRYSDARRVASTEGTPIVVLVGAKWCPACVTMKQSVMPKLRKTGALNGVVYAQVDLDEEKQLGRQLIEGSRIPQLVMFRKAGEGWKAKRLVGGQSTAVVKDFIKDGVRRDTIERAAASASMLVPVTMK